MRKRKLHDGPRRHRDRGTQECPGEQFPYAHEEQCLPAQGSIPFLGAAASAHCSHENLAQSYAGYKTCLAASRSEISLSHLNGASIRVLQSQSAELHPIAVSTSATDFARTAPYSAIFAAQVVCSTTEGSKISFLCCSMHALACVLVPLVSPASTMTVASDKAAMVILRFGK